MKDLNRSIPLAGSRSAAPRHGKKETPGEAPGVEAVLAPPSPLLVKERPFRAAKGFRKKSFLAAAGPRGAKRSAP